MARKARIGGTLGPACDSAETLARLVEAGLDVARLNFSHGEAADHIRRTRLLRRVSRQADRPTALLADLQGPRFRVGTLAGGQLVLRSGDFVEVVAGRKRSREGTIPVSYDALAGDVRRGHPILMDDGNIALRVDRVRGSSVHCTVERGGELTDHKGINLPESLLSVPTLTTKDRRDLRLAVELEADWLAVSFVRSGDDIRQARRLLKRAGSEARVMAKIERAEAIERLDDIIAEADGILVARGDMGVELAPARVPMLQKQIIEASNVAGKPVMTATQMLESMRHSTRPTRAEASDVANAVLDGSDSLLLTAETAVGQHPVAAVATMHRIIVQAEASGRARYAGRSQGGELRPVTYATARAGCRAAYDAQARYIVVFTKSGYSADQVARFRPRTPILAVTPSLKVARRLSVVWGVRSFVATKARTVESMVRVVDDALVERTLAKRGDVVVVLAGAPGTPGTTNLVNVRRVGDPIGRRRT